MINLPRKRSETGPYRLAVPMTDETLKIVDRFCEEWECTRTEAARWLLLAAALQYAAGDLNPA